MPARRFFVILKTGREQAYRDKNSFLKELCYVASVALGDGEYVKKLITAYHADSIDPGTKPKGRVLDSEDPATGAFMKRFFASAAKGVTRGH